MFTPEKRCGGRRSPYEFRFGTVAGYIPQVFGMLVGNRNGRIAKSADLPNTYSAHFRCDSGLEVECGVKLHQLD
jgi:hypothetical protein